MINLRPSDNIWFAFIGVALFIVAAINVSISGNESRKEFPLRKLPEEVLVVEQLQKSPEFAEEKHIRSRRAMVSGDPHFKTWTGERFDFHGVCDLVLLSNPRYGNGAGMKIHLRTKEIGTSYSYVAAAVVSVGDSVLEVMGGRDKNQYWLNEVAGNEELKTGDSFKFGENGDVHFTQHSSKAREFSIKLDGTNSNQFHLVIKTWNGMVSVAFDGETKSADFDGSLGLIGSYPHGFKLSRDGSSVIKDLNTFGQEWQVLPKDGSLFHEAGDGPQFPRKCDIPSIHDMRRRLSTTRISITDAEIACNGVGLDDFDLCVFDIIATNNKESAGAY